MHIAYLILPYCALNFIHFKVKQHSLHHNIHNHLLYYNKDFTYVQLVSLHHSGICLTTHSNLHWITFEFKFNSYIRQKSLLIPCLRLLSKTYHSLVNVFANIKKILWYILLRTIRLSFISFFFFVYKKVKFLMEKRI